MIPCKDCITLGVCKGMIDSYQDFYFHMFIKREAEAFKQEYLEGGDFDAHTLRGRISEKLKLKCSIFRDYTVYIWLPQGEAKKRIDSIAKMYPIKQEILDWEKENDKTDTL